jgi:mono/diheme cytochrome c family protein
MNEHFKRAGWFYRSLFAGMLLRGGFMIPILLIPATAAFAGQQASAPEQAAYFEKNIQPIFTKHCYDCHSTDGGSAGGLRLDNREGLLKGGKSGPAIILGKPEESLLLRRIQSDNPKTRMPKGEDQPLSAKEITDLKTWVEQGAFWPATKEATASVDHSALVRAGARATVYPRPATPEQLAYFEKNVRPILVNRCYNCHSDAFKEAGGLRVDVGISIFAGGNDGPVIIPGHPEKSLLIERVKSTDSKKRMPQESTEALPAEEIAILETWIKNGAAWPDETEKLPQTPARLAAAYPKLRAHYWSWQPLTNPAVPAVADTAWSSTNIDRFILARLEEKKLAPVKDADPVTLIRRLSYDLTGLPPSPEEVKAFQKDHSSAAYIKLVDRLLASQQFGERWGRHWLDVARYAESSGPSRNMPYPNAWRYRDYVIDSFNRDVPYNRFIQEQLAGDLLLAATPAEHDRLLIATGFLALGPKDVNQRFKARFKMDNVDDQIDTVTRSTMALTVSCARCHDHKFDPIPATDYYALAGIFTSTEDDAGLGSKMGGSSLDYYEPKHLGYLSTASQAAPIPKEQVNTLKAERDAAKKELDAIKEKDDAALKANPVHPPLTASEKQKRLELQKYLVQRKEDAQLIDDLGERGYGVHSVSDGVIADTTVRIRGVEERHGPAVPRGFLTLLDLPDTPQIPANHSGRLELAQWITRPDNPLTSRVYVNRVWQHLFGVGIVSSLDNFGSTGDQPSNPELLDYLAQDFIRNGWSTKKLVREIVLTRAYRLGFDIPAGYHDIDPADHLVWRHAPRRLEAEEIRDSILASSGQLDLDHPQGSPSMALRMIEVRDDGQVVHSILASADRSHYRSIYLPLLRDETPRPLAAFDPVSQTLVTGQRDETTVPTQALFMLNSSFVRQQSLAFAGRLLADRHPSDTERIRQAYERVLGHDPTPQDTVRVKAFLVRYSDTWNNSHPVSVTSGRARVVLTGSPVSSSITAGIIRSDGLTQDDAVDDTSQASSTSQINLPDTAREAAWAAFVQSLYGSAAFQFVR